MAFTENAFKAYPLRTQGNLRLWKFGGGNGNTTGQLVSSPSALLVEVFGNAFDSGTATLQYSTDNSSFSALSPTVAFTSASGAKLVYASGVLTGFYRFALTGTAGSTADLVGLLLSLNSTDIE